MRLDGALPDGASAKQLFKEKNGVFYREVRKYTKSKGSFTSEDALFKIVYAAYERIKLKWNQPIRNVSEESEGWGFKGKRCFQ